MGKREKDGLTELDKKLICDIYDMKYNNGVKFTDKNYELGIGDDIYAKSQALVYYIDRLCEKGILVTYPNEKGKYYYGAGRKHAKFGNNAISIEVERVDLTQQGIEYVQNLRKKFGYKFKNWLNNNF